MSIRTAPSRALVAVMACAFAATALTACQSAEPASRQAASASAAPEAGASAGVEQSPEEAQWDDFVIDEARVTVLAYPTTVMNRQPMRGQALTINNGSARLYSLIGCAFGCGPDSFNLPTADGPLATLSGTPDVPGALMWQITARGSYPTTPPDDVYPGQVLFTAMNPGPRTQVLLDNGFTPLDLGEQVASGISAFQAPSNWPATTRMPVLGELRLFPAGKALPASYTPADGHAVDQNSNLGLLLYSAYYPKSGTSVMLPKMPAVAGFQWAIASNGMWPPT